MREVRKMQASYSKDITQLQKKISSLVSSVCKEGIRLLCIHTSNICVSSVVWGIRSVVGHKSK